MQRVLSVSPLTLSLMLLAIATAIGFAAFVPWARKAVMYKLGITDPSQASLAAIRCPLQEQRQVTDPDRIYFLSCGGIY